MPQMVPDAAGFTPAASFSRTIAGKRRQTALKGVGSISPNRDGPVISSGIPKKMSIAGCSMEGQCIEQLGCAPGE